MAPPMRDRSKHTYNLCFLLLASTATLSTTVTASPYSSACPSLPPAHDRHTDGDDAVALIRSFQISAGQFSGGAAGLFSPDDDPYSTRSFHFFAHGASRTDEPALIHLTATLTLVGPRSWHRGGHHYHSEAASIAFVLDGYHSSASLELCMVGTGTEHAADGSLKQYPDVVLRLHVPSPPSLAEPFVSGSMEGSSDLGTIRLLAYAGADHYKYDSERAACSPGPSRLPVSGSLRALGGVNSVAVCAHLKEQLMISYRLEHGRAPYPRMRVNQMQCSADGAALRAYAVLFNDTRPTERGSRRRRFMVGEEALVADGHWDQARRMLCLRACRVTLLAPPSAPVVDCGIGMSFWFPAVWTMRERRAVAGMLWNSSQADTEPMSIIDDDQRSNTNISDVKYSYNDTMLEEAMKHHQAISKGKKITWSDSFPDFNSSNGDAEFSFQALDIRGQAYPVTIGSGMVADNILADDDAFSRRWVVYGSTPTAAAARHAVVDDMKEDLLNVSYVIRYSAPRDKFRVRPSNVASYSNYSDSIEKRKILAEGIYDRKRGILCMVGCQERNGSTDCQTLVTVQFASLNYKAQEHGTGVISSLRDKTDRLFFEKIDFTLHGMYSTQAAKAISRMDMESIMLVASTTLSCVFTILQILHTKRNPEVPPATSVTMLAVLTMGHLAPLMLNSEALFASRRSQYYDSYPTSRRLEMNEAMMRVPTLIAFVLQLRLLQLVWSGRRTSTVSERTVLWICLPLYVLGGVVAAVVHMIKARTAVRGDPWAINMGGGPAAIWQDLVSYAGLILDGFLLPQVILNASLGGSRARAISPWFYMGGTMIRLMPHVYDVVRAQMYKPSMRSSNLYASPRSDLFGVAWDVVIPCGVALLALLLFLQQRLPGTASLPSQRRRSGGYEMVSNI